MWIPITLAAAGLGALVLPALKKPPAASTLADADPWQGPSDPRPKPEPRPQIDPNTVPPATVQGYMDRLRAMTGGGIQTYGEAPTGPRSIHDGEVMNVVRKFQVNWNDGAYYSTWPMPLEIRLRNDGILDRKTMEAINQTPVNA